MRRGLDLLVYPREQCECGCLMVACPSCAMPRCLHYDPLCEDEPSCHDADPEVSESRSSFSDLNVAVRQRNARFKTVKVRGVTSVNTIFVKLWRCPNDGI